MRCGETVRRVFSSVERARYSKLSCLRSSTAEHTERNACSSMRRVRCGITRTRSTGQRLGAPALAIECSSSSFSIALLQRRQRGGQHAAAAARQQLLRGQQRVQLLGVQPQARQLEAVAFAGVVAEAGFAIAHHRRHQRVAQEREVAIDGGARAAQFVLQPRHRHRAARGLEDAVQADDAFVTVHAGDYGCRAVRACAAAQPLAYAALPATEPLARHVDLRASFHTLPVACRTCWLAAATGCQACRRRQRRAGTEAGRRASRGQGRLQADRAKDAVIDGQFLAVAQPSRERMATFAAVRRLIDATSTSSPPTAMQHEIGDADGHPFNHRRHRSSVSDASTCRAATTHGGRCPRARGASGAIRRRRAEQDGMTVQAAGARHTDGWRRSERPVHHEKPKPTSDVTIVDQRQTASASRSRSTVGRQITARRRGPATSTIRAKPADIARNWRRRSTCPLQQCSVECSSARASPAVQPRMRCDSRARRSGDNEAACVLAAARHNACMREPARTCRRRPATRSRPPPATCAPAAAASRCT